MRFNNDRIPVILPQMPHQIALLHKRLVALRTREGLLATVRSPVRDQVALADKVLRTEVAAEGAIRCRALVMAAHME